MKILILCTGNSCRSQMAEALLKSFNPKLQVFSAGTNPALQVHPLAIQVMAEIGIDLSQNYPKTVESFLKEDFDYVITVCDHAKESCPVFLGQVKKRIHLGFEDPGAFEGSESEKLNRFRKTRDEIRQAFWKLYEKELKPQLNGLGSFTNK